MFWMDLELWEFMFKVGFYLNDFIIDDYVYIEYYFWLSIIILNRFEGNDIILEIN